MTRTHEPDIKAFLLSLGREIPRDDFVLRRENEKTVADVHRWLVRRVEFFVPLRCTKQDVHDLAQETLRKLISRATHKPLTKHDIQGSGAEYIMTTLKSVICDFSRKRHTITLPRIKNPAAGARDDHPLMTHLPPLWSVPLHSEDGEPNPELIDEDRHIRTMEAIQMIDQMEKDLSADLLQTVQIIAVGYINEDSGLSAARKAGCGDEEFEKKKGVLRRALRKLFSLP